MHDHRPLVELETTQRIAERISASRSPRLAPPPGPARRHLARRLRHAADRLDG